MGRSNRPRRSKRSEDAGELNLDIARMGFKKTEVKRGVLYSVQTSTGSNAEAGKSWVCPHCNISISIGQSHIVAWDEVRGVETRRHFHTGCWSKFQGPLL